MDIRNMRDFSPDVFELADRLTKMTLAQAAQLRICLEEIHGIRAAVSLSAVKEKEVIASTSPEPTHFSVILTGLADADRKISVFKSVREITGLGLRETRELVDGAPSVISANLLKEVATAVLRKLESAGARVTLVPV